MNQCLLFKRDLIAGVFLQEFPDIVFHPQIPRFSSQTHVGAHTATGCAWKVKDQAQSPVEAVGDKTK